MPLVDYSDSDNEPHDNVQKSQKATDLLPATTKRKRDNDDLPALPSKFHDLYASTSRLSMHDDPSLHGGRKRITPHIAGNWPTHLYIECMFCHWGFVPVIYADWFEGIHRL